MIQTVLRPFTDQEKDKLESELLTLVNKPFIVVRNILPSIAFDGFFGLAWGIIFAGILTRFGRPILWIVFAVLGGLIFGIGLSINRILGSAKMAKYHANRRKPQLAKRLLRGEIEEVTVTASAVVTVSDPEHEDYTRYFFDIGDNKILYISEAILDFVDSAPMSENQLPTLSFRYTYFANELEEIVEFKVLGPPLRPVRTINAYEVEFHETFYELVSGTIIENASLATLETDLPFFDHRGKP